MTGSNFLTASGSSLGSLGSSVKLKFFAVEFDSRAISVYSKVADCSYAKLSGYLTFLSALTSYFGSDGA